MPVANHKDPALRPPVQLRKPQRTAFKTGPDPTGPDLSFRLRFDFFHAMAAGIPGRPLCDEVLDIEIRLRAETLLVSMPGIQPSGCCHEDHDSCNSKQFSGGHDQKFFLE